MNRNTPNLQKLPDYIKTFLEGLDDETWEEVASAMHGGRISGGSQKQKQLYQRLTKHIPDIKEINGKFDFVTHDRKMYIDSKSPGYNNNVPAKDVVNKYKTANKENYEMYFIVTGNKTSNVGWPVETYKELGINILTEKQFLEVLYGQKK